MWNSDYRGIQRLNPFHHVIILIYDSQLILIEKELFFLVHVPGQESQLFANGLKPPQYLYVIEKAWKGCRQIEDSSALCQGV